MSFWKRVLFLLSLFVLLLGALGLPFRDALTERYSVLQNGWGDRTWLWAAAGEDGLFCAASRDGADRVLAPEKVENGLELRFFNRRGDVLSDWPVSLPREAVEGELCALYPADRDTAFLAFWQEEGMGGERLCLYRAVKGGGAEALLSQAGRGTFQSEQRRSVQISSFSRSLDQVLFVLQYNGHVVSYACPVRDGGVVKQEEQVRDDVLSAAALLNGSLAMSGEGFLLVPGRTNTKVSPEQSFSRLTCSASGLYCVESRTMTVWYSDLSGVALQQLFSLDTAAGEARMTSLSLTPSGGALLLLDGHRLCLMEGGGVTNLTSALYPARGGSLAAFLAYGALSAFLAFVLWQTVAIVQRNRISLSLYWGTVVLSLALALGAAAWYRIVSPAGERAALERRSELLGALAGLALREDSRGTAPLPAGGTVNTGAYSQDFLSRRVDALLSDAGAENARNPHVVLARREGRAWVLDDGTRAELDGWFHPALADRAEEDGVCAAQDGDRFWYCRSLGGRMLCASLTFAYGTDTALVSAVWRSLLCWCAALSAVLLAILILVNISLRRLAFGLERYAGGGAWKPLRLRSGDEVEGMAASLNALASNRTAEEVRRNELVASYRRFVPESVISLLGKKSILDVDKKSFAVRNMSIMAVSYTFPDAMYVNQDNARDSTRFLFDSINQVIERTATIAEQKGGTVFNFNYDSYDVVLDSASAAVSAAVAMGQEVLSFNERRTAEGLPLVTLRMALDKGSVVIGIIGDEEHLEQTTISTRFATVHSLLQLCGKLDAGILCTERALSGTGGCRYMGKCRLGQEAERIYEIFDADPYEARTQKAATLRKFSAAVLSLYSGDAAAARRSFLELAHETPGDGGARYYLYLANQLEQNPDLPYELNGDE